MSYLYHLTEADLHDPFQIERNQLLESYLNRYYFLTKELPHEGRSIELFVTSKCSGNCEYCYLMKHGEDLYPSELQDRENLVNNCKIFVNWYKKNKFRIPIEIFSGEIVKNGLLFELFDVFYEAFSSQKTIYKPALIRLAENGDFLEDEKLIKKMQEYIDKFKLIDINITLSLSIDGKYMDKVNRNRKRDDAYYKRAFDFCIKNFYAFHPMVAASNIEHWIENFDWWKSDSLPSVVTDECMMLEVRNNDWTSEKLQHYVKFLNHVIDYEFNKVDKDKDTFVKRILRLDDYPGKGYRNYSLYFVNNIYSDTDKAGSACSINNNLCIRLGDLALVPCHRTSYKDFIMGHFIVENDEIIGYHCENMEIDQAINSWGRITGPKCKECFNRYYCSGVCFGSNYETNNEIFLPPEKACNMLKTRTAFLITKFDELNLMPYFKKYLNKKDYDTLMSTYDALKRGLDNYGLLLQNGIDNAFESGKGAGAIKL